MKEKMEKYELFISISLIVIYVLLNSFCMNQFGDTDYRSVFLNLGLSVGIVIFIIKNKLLEYYGLVRVDNYKKFLYFIPLVIIVLFNFINGIVVNHTVSEIIFYILNMVFVGFLEEIIFRGFLFKAMEKDNLKSAIIVTSLTFGVGHIVNLLNGSEFIPTMLQIGYSFSIGYLFVNILIKSKSLYPAIITHIMINSLGIFSNISSNVSLCILSVCLIVCSSLYTVYIKRYIK